MIYEPTVKSLTLVHVTTPGMTVAIRVKTVFDGELVIEWPLSGSYRIRRAKMGGFWKSIPNSLMKSWALTAESSVHADQMVREEAKHRDIEQKKRRGTWA